MSKSTRSDTNQSDDRTALVVGAGLVGTLCAAMLASRGWTVTLIEYRADPRLGTHAERARSINLALSPRGIEAIRSVSEELVERVLKEGIEMRGRMVHKKAKREGEPVEKDGQDYGNYDEGECIRSTSRTGLGIQLLDHLDGLPKQGRGSVTTLFETKLVEMDLRKEHGVDVVLQKKGREGEKRHFDFVVGGDGAYSQVRQQMMRGSRLRCACGVPWPPACSEHMRRHSRNCTSSLGKDIPCAQLRLPTVLCQALVPRAVDPSRSERDVPARAELPAHLAARRVHADRAGKPGESFRDCKAAFARPLRC
jgi:2-polyprenyl-6-methoxyphenol hydroxylase-like FAD-dependent oxidoreductase